MLSVCLSPSSALVVHSEESAGATLIGRVIFRGAAPPPQKVTVRRDQETCGAEMTLQPLIVDGATGGVKDAVVTVAGLHGEATEASVASARLSTGEGGVVTNRECAFVPRVGVALVGRPLEIRNDDPVMHNAHIRHENRTFINVAQVPGGRPIQKVVKAPGVMTIVCDKHPFMRAHRIALDHPYFAVTDSGGSFRIAKAPPGLREIAVWHETLGTLTKKFVVPAQGDVTVTFEYP